MLAGTAVVAVAGMIMPGLMPGMAIIGDGVTLIMVVAERFGAARRAVLVMMARSMGVIQRTGTIVRLAIERGIGARPGVAVIPFRTLGALTRTMPAAAFSTTTTTTAALALARPLISLGLGCGFGVGLFLLQQFAVGDRDLVVVGMDFGEGQEAVAIAAIFHESRLQRRLDARNLGQIDIAAQQFSRC